MLLLLVFGVARVSSAQEVFRISGASRHYDLSVRVKQCGGAEQDNHPNTCSGPARVSVYRKGARSPFQTLNLPNVEIYKETLAYGSQTDAAPRKLYAEEYGFVFDDFNFDDAEDMAICNGRNSGYGGPSYNVFLFDAKSRGFVENKKLTALAEGAYLGLFFLDSKRKQLVAHSKSGCCYHETEKYKFVRNRPVLVEQITEQVTGREDDALDVVTTTRRRVNGRWVERVKREVVKKN